MTTFRVHKLSDFLQKSIETFKQMLESEMLMGGNRENTLDYTDDDGTEGADSPNKEDKNAAAAA